MTLIRPVILYGSEKWTSRKIEEIRLDIFERKILRRIYEPCLVSTQEPENEEFEPMRNYIACSKDQVFQGKSQKED
jgi:hypothetical protein